MLLLVSDGFLLNFVKLYFFKNKYGLVQGKNLYLFNDRFSERGC